jgi:hypothetical protein
LLRDEAVKRGKIVPKIVEFTRLDVGWVHFTPDPDTGEAQLQAYGTLTNEQGMSLPREINGWEGVPEKLQAQARAILRQLMAVRAAHELGVDPQDIEKVLDIGPNYLQFKPEQE